MKSPLLGRLGQNKGWATFSPHRAFETSPLLVHLWGQNQGTREVG